MIDVQLTKYIFNYEIWFFDMYIKTWSHQDNHDNQHSTDFPLLVFPSTPSVPTQANIDLLSVTNNQ